jgi:hypothetical protein
MAISVFQRLRNKLSKTDTPPSPPSITSSKNDHSGTVKKLSSIYSTSLNPMKSIKKTTEYFRNNVQQNNPTRKQQQITLYPSDPPEKTDTQSMAPKASAPKNDNPSK